MKKIRGFTIIELLIVILVIGCLATIGTFEYITQLKNNRDATRKTDLNAISVALDMFRNDQTNPNYQKYPNSIDSHPKNPVTITQLRTEGFGSYGGYLANISEDPLNASNPNIHYYYISDIKGLAYKLSAQMELDQELSKNDGGTSNDWYELFSNNGQNLPTPQKK